MTRNNAVKKAARARMAETGEKYTEARRATLAEFAILSVEFDFEPDTVTAIISGGGMTNFALVLPSLIRMADEGHPVFIASHERYSKPNLRNLASPFDVLVASGRIGADELVDRWSSDDADDNSYLASLINQHPMSFSLTSRTSAEWVELLAPSGDTGKHAVLYVPDLQVDFPLTDWHSREAGDSMSDYELMPAQLAGLRALARQAGAAVVGGHCMPVEAVDGWHVVAGIVDEAVVIKTMNQVRSEDMSREVELDFYPRYSLVKNGPSRTEKTKIDLRFDMWRQIDMERR